MNKLAWGSLGVLVAACLGLMFWLDWLLGAIFAAFVLAVWWLVFAIHKKEVDRQIAAVAKRLNLTVKRHPLRYAGMIGSYRGHPVSISFQSASTFGLGSILVADGAPPGLAALDVQTRTLVCMHHGLAPQPRRLLDPGPPPIQVKGEYLRLVLPGTCTDRARLQDALERLEHQVKTPDRTIK